MPTTAIRRVLAVCILFASGFALGAQAADPTPKPSLTSAQLAGFREGLAIFKQAWPVAGRERNENSCGACHHRPVIGGSGFNYNANILHSFTVEHASRESGISRWPLEITDERFGTGKVVLFHELQERTPADRFTNAVSRRVSRPLHGMGSLELIPEAAIRTWADPNDADRDGISGRFLGRFGSQGQWKTIEQVVREALVEEVGLPPSSILESDVADLVAFARGLRDPVEVPLPDLATTVIRGRQLFSEIGCADCHRPSFVLADGRTQIRPYSDLLVHDMGPCLDDGVALGDAESYEWLTAPLWGLRSRGTEILHDGRGGRPVQAIQFHCGEATASRIAFNQLDGSGQAAIRFFLETMRAAD